MLQDAIIREKYAETQARLGLATGCTVGLRQGAQSSERRAPTSASLVGNTMNIVRSRMRALRCRNRRNRRANVD